MTGAERAARPNVRVLAIDDAPFPYRGPARVRLVGVLTRGPSRLEGVYTTTVLRDGWRATHAIAALVERNRLAGQAAYVLLDGITVAGFNFVDLPALAARTGMGVVAVVRRRPDLDAFFRAMKRVSRAEQRQVYVERAGPLHEAGAVWFQCAGAEPDAVRTLLTTLTVQGNYPEPLRIAHLIAAGLVLGRSRGGA